MRFCLYIVCRADDRRRAQALLPRHGLGPARGPQRPGASPQDRRSPPGDQLGPGRPATVGELAEYLALSSEEVLDGLQTGEAYDTISLDAPRPGDDDGPVNRLEAIGDEDDRIGRVDEQATIFAAAQQLPERERQILFLRFGADLTQSEIAQRVGVSQMQVSRLLRRSLQRLRDLTEERAVRP